MPPWVVVTTGGVLSAASWTVLARFWMTCACCASNEARSSGDNSISEASNLSDDGGEGGKGGKGGKGGNSADGNRPVFTNTQVGSVQPATIDGNAGGFDEEFGSLRAMNGLTVLPAPPLAIPLAEELLMVPTGKLEPGNRTRLEIDELGVGAGEAADRAVGAARGVARRARAIDAAEIGANESTDDVV